MDEITQGFWNAFRLLISLDSELFAITLLSLRVSGTAVFFASLTAIPAGIGVAFLHFRGKNILRAFLNTLMGFPPVVMGLLVYLIISNQGPLGSLNLLYSPEGMILVQFFLAFPIIMGLTLASIESTDPKIRESALSLCGSEKWAIMKVIVENQRNIIAGIIVGFGQTISEVGAIMIVGGNIRWRTRVLTSGIVREVSRGEYALAIALGIILISLSFLITTSLTYLQTRDLDPSSVLIFALELLFIANLSLFRVLANLESNELLTIQKYLLIIIPITTIYSRTILTRINDSKNLPYVIVLTMFLLIVVPFTVILRNLIIKLITIILIYSFFLILKIQKLPSRLIMAINTMILTVGISTQVSDGFLSLFLAILLTSFPITLAIIFSGFFWLLFVYNPSKDQKRGKTPLFRKLELSSLSKSFDGIQILKNVSLTAEKAEIICILGPSGAGKTTLLRIISGFLNPDTGYINVWIKDDSSTFNHQEKAEWLHQNSILVHQDPIMFDDSTWKNVEFGLKKRNYNTSSRRQRIEKALKQVRLDNSQNRNSKTLSGGEKQRVALARAISLTPSILFIDEPTANLDPTNVKLIEKSLKELNKQGMTIVMATHNLHQARRLADHVALLFEGEIIEFSDTSRFFNNPKDPRTTAFIRGDMIY
ncbi:MAG: ABC transporter permease [Promethearchaeota archaeon]